MEYRNKTTGAIYSRDAFLKQLERGVAESDFEHVGGSSDGEDVVPLPPPPPPPVPEGMSGHDQRHLGSGAVYSHEAYLKQLDGGASPSDFEIASAPPADADAPADDGDDGDSGDTEAAVEAPQLPPGDVRHIPSGAIYSAVAQGNMVASGRATAADFESAVDPPAPPDKPEAKPKPKPKPKLKPADKAATEPKAAAKSTTKKK